MNNSSTELQVIVKAKELAKHTMILTSNANRYLGFHHYVTSDGKYIRKLAGENKRKIKRKLKRWSIAVNDGKMSEDKFMEKYNAWKNHVMHGNCIKLCQSMDAYVETLLGKEKSYGR